MNAIPTQQEWMFVLKEYAAATGLDKFSANAGASEDQLAATEERLKIKLPLSYRTFLSACNGCKFDSDMPLIIRPVEKIRWFRKEHKDWYDAYQMSTEPLSALEKDYFDYAKQDCIDFEIKHLAQALCISEIRDDAVVLLNPMVIWPDGEWETWFFSNSAPGATRYRSFADWMADELEHSFENRAIPDQLPTVYLDAPGKQNRRVRPRPKVPMLEDVLKKLKSKKETERVKAAEELAFLGGGLAVHALVEVLKDPEWRVRWTAADSLGVLRPPEALEVLISAADGSLDGVNVNAIGALASYNDERSAQFLLSFLAHGGGDASTAAHALAKRGDIRAIQPLENFLTATASNNPKIQRIGDIAGRIIAEFGMAGYAALERLITHPDAKVRSRAESGVSDMAYGERDKCLRRKAFENLQRCLTTEVDVGLRQSIEISIKISAKKNLSTR